MSCSPRCAWIVRLTWAAPLLASVATGQPQRPLQQACIVDAMGRGALAVADAQAARTTACVRAAGATVDPACFADDPTGEVARAAAALTATVATTCTDAPDFGVSPRLAEHGIAAGTVHGRGLATDLFGTAVPTAALAPNALEQRCRLMIARQAERLARTLRRDALGCQRDRLRAGATTAGALATCIDGPVQGTAQRAATQLAQRVRRACRGVAIAAAAPGRCADTTPDTIGGCVAARVACRTCRFSAATGGLDPHCDLADDGADNDSCRMPVSVSGDVLPFHLVPNGRLAGATISILEHPDRQVVTGSDGHFAFDDLDEGSEITLVLSHPDYHPIQTGTIRLGPAGAERVTFQAVIHGIYAALAALLQVTPDDAHACQMVTTLTRVGKSMYDTGAHGEDGAVVQLHPPLPAVHGPIYFNSSVLPDRRLVESSDDGGVLFIQVPPGEYTWTATKPGSAFSRITMKCRPGFLVNASPPWGLQRQ